MHARWLAASTAAVLLLCGMEGQASAYGNGPPAITVFPDDFPADVSFFFPAGGPLERFTSRPGAWYAIYRTPLYPGRPYDLILEHSGDPTRIKIFALDNHPFERVSVKAELHPVKAEGRRHSSGTAYVATIALPRDSAVYGVYLLMEWNPPPGENKPLPVSLQVLSVETRPRMGQGRTWWWPWADNNVNRPLQSQNRNPHVIPVPRSEPGGRKMENRNEGERYRP